MSSPKPNFVDVSNQGRKSIIWQDKESENSECQLCKEKGISKILFTKGTTKTALDHLKHIHGITGKSTKVNDNNKSNIFEKKETVEEAVTKLCIDKFILSGHVPEIQAEVEVVKIKNPDFSCWA